MVGGSTRVCFLSWSEIPLTYLFFLEKLTNTQIRRGIGIASCPLQVKQMLAISVPFQPQAGQAARKAIKKRGNSAVPLQVETFLGFKWFQEARNPVPAVGVWGIYCWYCSGTLYCEIPTMWCQVGLWWNTSLVHWGYQLSCSWGHHIEPLKRIKLSCPRRHFPMAKGVVVVDDDVTAPVPAEFPTSRRAPAGATMPGVVGGAWDEGPIYCIRLYQIWWDCQEMEDLPWMYGHAIE